MGFELEKTDLHTSPGSSGSLRWLCALSHASPLSGPQSTTVEHTGSLVLSHFSESSFSLQMRTTDGFIPACLGRCSGQGRWKYFEIQSASLLGGHNPQPMKRRLLLSLMENPHSYPQSEFTSQPILQAFEMLLPPLGSNKLSQRLKNQTENMP